MGMSILRPTMSSDINMVDPPICLLFFLGDEYSGTSYSTRLFNDAEKDYGCEWHCVCDKLVQSCPTLCDPTIAHPPLLSLRFSRQEYWSGLPCSPPEGIPDPGIKPASLTSPALSGRFSTI